MLVVSRYEITKVLNADPSKIIQESTEYPGDKRILLFGDKVKIIHYDFGGIFLESGYENFDFIMRRSIRWKI